MVVGAYYQVIFDLFSVSYDTQVIINTVTTTFASLLIQKSDTQLACTSSAKLSQLTSRLSLSGILQMVVQASIAYFV